MFFEHCHSYSSRGHLGCEQESSKKTLPFSVLVPQCWPIAWSWLQKLNLHSRSFSHMRFSCSMQGRSLKCVGDSWFFSGFPPIKETSPGDAKQAWNLGFTQFLAGCAESCAWNKSSAPQLKKSLGKAHRNHRSSFAWSPSRATKFKDIQEMRMSDHYESVALLRVLILCSRML